jgi:glycosyltransferase involved in cell wall biosynthesis
VIDVCIDARMIRCGGIGTFLKNVLRAVSNKTELTLLCWERDVEYLTQFKPKKMITMKSAIYSWQEQFELFFKIPKVTFFWSPHFNIPLLPIRAKKRIVTIHDLYYLSSIHFFQSLYARIFYNASCLFSDCVTTDSQFSKSEILRKIFFKPKKLSVITLPISVKKPASAAIVKALKQKYSLPDRFVLAVGSHRPHKNLKKLFNAYLEPIVVVGKFNEISVKRENLHYVGTVTEEELEALYSLATCLIFPSLYEGFGLPPLEAMACGCPAVVSDIPVHKEVCGSAAIYCDPLNEKSILEAIESVVMRREEMIVKGSEHVKKYPWSLFEKSVLKELR